MLVGMSTIEQLINEIFLYFFILSKKMLFFLFLLNQKKHKNSQKIKKHDQQTHRKIPNFQRT